jgi:hypothetical protein
MGEVFNTRSWYAIAATPSVAAILAKSPVRSSFVGAAAGKRQEPNRDLVSSSCADRIPCRGKYKKLAKTFSQGGIAIS